MALAICAVLAALAGTARAALPPGLSRAEAGCERAFGPATDLFGAGIARCLVRCDARAGRGEILVRSACPYAGSTLRCIDRARAAAERRIARGCGRDCPECYAGGDCATYGRGALDVTRLVVDGFARQTLCDDAASADGLSTPEARCRRATGAALATAARALGACYVRCRRRAERTSAVVGPIDGACASATNRPASVSACLDRVLGTATREIGRRCVDPPECLPEPAALLAAVAEQIRSDYDVLIFCASPGGAFVDGE